MVAVNKRLHGLISEVMYYMLVIVVMALVVVAAIGASYLVWELTPFYGVPIIPLWLELSVRAVVGVPVLLVLYTVWTVIFKRVYGDEDYDSPI